MLRGFWSVAGYRRFGTTYESYLQGSRWARQVVLKLRLPAAVRTPRNIPQERTPRHELMFEILGRHTDAEGCDAVSVVTS